MLKNKSIIYHAAAIRSFSLNPFSSNKPASDDNFKAVHSPPKDPSNVPAQEPAVSAPPPPTPVAESSTLYSDKAPQLPDSAFDNALDLSSPSLLDMPEHIGYLKSLGLDFGWGPTSVMQWTLEHVHVYAGTPWWISICLTALLVRVVMLKLFLNSSDNAARMASVQTVTKPLTEKMTALRISGDVDSMNKIRYELKQINDAAGVKLWRSFAPLVQVFAGYGTFVIIRQMAKIPVPGLETGGILWFHNLAVPDPYLLIPLATAGILHLVFRVC